MKSSMMYYNSAWLTGGGRFPVANAAFSNQNGKYNCFESS